jgi:endonuclease YncB( thermonuclease family)
MQAGVSMSEWAYKRGVRRILGIDLRLIPALVLMAGLLFYYAHYRHSERVPLAPVNGYARVVDGDSIEIAGVRIRLDGVDAPELDQSCTDANGRAWSCGMTAADALRRHLRGRELRCEPSGRDQFRRTIAVCAFPDGSDVNAWLVRQGWALASGRSGDYRSEQNEAQAGRRGIWAGTFTPPKEWRQRQAQ